MVGAGEIRTFLAGANRVGAAANPGVDELTIIENSSLGIYEGMLAGEIAAGVIYSKTVNNVALLATSVFPAFRGLGIPARLLTGILERLRPQGVTVTMICPFAAEFANAHPEYADFLQPCRGAQGPVHSAWAPVHYHRR
jgi:predicted GNAT family acetyltransferase